MATKPSDGGEFSIVCDRGSGAMWTGAKFDTYLGSTQNSPWDLRDLTYRFDEEKPVHGLWSFFEDSVAQFHWATLKDFLAELPNSQTLALRTGTYEGVAVTMVVDLADIKPTLSRMHQLCPLKSLESAKGLLILKESDVFAAAFAHNR